MVGWGLTQAFRNRRYPIFPGGRYSFYRFSDGDSGGATRLGNLEHGKCIRLEYTLRKSEVSPVAGFGLCLEDDSGRDLSAFDTLVLELQTSHGQEISIGLAFNSPYFPPSSDDSVYKEYRTSTRIKRTAYSVRLGDFNLADWWLADHGDYQAADDRLLFREIEFLDDGGENLDEVKSLIIGAAYFENGFAARLTNILLALACLSGALTALVTLKLIRMVRFAALMRKFIPAFNPASVPREDERLIAYIHANFADENLSLARINRETGISKHLISEILVTHYHMQFKPYINRLRIAESKRLLDETELTVTEVGFRVGYNSATHFGRVFRELAGVTPQEYRKTPKTANCR